MKSASPVESRCVTELPPSVRDQLAVLTTRGELPLPVLPDVATRVLALVQHPSCDVHALTAVIRRDPSLTARILEIASSPIYATAVRVGSIAQIVARLGFDTIMQLTMAIASGRVFAVPGFEPELAAASRHAFTTALFAQEVARSRRSAVDVAFIAGLLHDVGIPVVIQVLVDLHRSAGLSIDRVAVLAVADAEHVDAGRALAARWATAPVIAEAIHRHHAPDGHELAHIVALADALAHDTDPQGHAQALNLYPEDIAAIARKRDHIAATVEVIA